MLVLSRKPGEKIHVGDVTVTVIKIRGNSVRIGIDAPAKMTISRVELRTNEDELDRLTTTTKDKR